MSRRVILWYLLGAVVVAAFSHPALSQERLSTANTAPSTDTTVVIYVPRDGEFYVDKDRVVQAEIPDRLRVDFKDTSPEGRVVHIRVCLDVSYTTVVSVIDTIRGAGLNQIGLVTDADSGSKPRAKSPTGGAGKVSMCAGDGTLIGGRANNGLAELIFSLAEHRLTTACTRHPISKPVIIHGNRARVMPGVRWLHLVIDLCEN